MPRRWAAVRERGRELRRGDVAVGRGQERPGDGAERRVRGLRGGGLQPLRGGARGRVSPQVGRVPRIERDLERADPPILDVDPGLVPHGRDPAVVEIETADGQIEQRPGFVRLDVGREHPRRGLRGPAADRAIVDHGAGHASHRELARDRAADDPGTDDDH